MDPLSSRTRSFGGCSTCRNRHVKCDELRPSCSMCIHSGLACGGYEISIFFDFEGPPNPAELRFRRPLLTEGERKRMSEWLTSSISPSRALREISQIEEEGEAAPTSQDFHIFRGPFGALRLGQVPSSPTCGETIELSHNAISQEYEQVDEDCIIPPEEAFSPRTQQLIHTVFDEASQHSTFDMVDNWNATDSCRIQEVFDDIDILMPEFRPSATCPVPQPPFTFVQSNLPDQVDIWNGANPEVDLALHVAIPQDAVSLLKHYSTTVLKLLTPFRHSKTPWHIMFIPHVKNCLAGLTLGENMDHASLCAFYGTLATSAFSLGGVSCSQMWLTQGRSYKQQARDHVRLMLKTAYDVPKTAKYKSILMALLTMVQLSMVSGNRDQTECYLVEAEKFIRVKGLNRKKSRKVRLLHHCYAFERMFHESIFVGGDKSSHRSHVRRAIESSGASAYSQDSLSFSPSKWIDLETELKRTKEKEEGENDLHLQLPGVWNKTLYPEIFGVPENYLILLSLTIRLAREKEEEAVGPTVSLKDFLHRAKAVERCINQLWHPRERTSVHDSQQQVSPPELDNILEAMQLAISIYFYRHVYDVDKTILQEKIARVRDCLLRCEEISSSDVYGTARLVWPAFIAASEAIDMDVQQSFAQWFANSAMRSGLRLFTDAQANLERTWEANRTAQGLNATWNEIMS